MPEFVNPVGPGLTSGRIDMGVDYAGSGPLYAMGSGTIVNVYNSGWPGGKFIALKLDSGQFMYYAENIIPKVTVGQRVSPGQIIGQAVGTYPYIEIGWAAPPGSGTTMAAASGEDAAGLAKGDPGFYPTAYGVSMSDLIKSLGGPPGSINGPVQGTQGENISGVTIAPTNTSLASANPPGCFPLVGMVAMGYYALQYRVKRRRIVSCGQRDYWKSPR